MKMRQIFQPNHTVTRPFSLVELLVVVSIISILMTLLAPSLNRAMDAAKNAKCMNVLKTINVALTLYAEDFNDVYMDSDGERGKGSNLAENKWHFYDFRPILKGYFSAPLNPSMVCPLALDYWDLSESSKIYPDPTKNPFNIDERSTTDGINYLLSPQPPYMLYPGNHTTSWFSNYNPSNNTGQLLSRMIRLGDSFHIGKGNGSAMGYSFDIVASDVLFRRGNSSYYASTHSPTVGEGLVKNFIWGATNYGTGSLGFGYWNSYNNEMPGWFLLPGMETSANFATADGAVQHFVGFSILGAVEAGFGGSFHSNRGYYFPLELGRK